MPNSVVPNKIIPKKAFLRHVATFITADMMLNPNYKVYSEEENSAEPLTQAVQVNAAALNGEVDIEDGCANVNASSNDHVVVLIPDKINTRSIDNKNSCDEADNADDRELVSQTFLVATSVNGSGDYSPYSHKIQSGLYTAIQKNDKNFKVIRPYSDFKLEINTLSLEPLYQYFSMPRIRVFIRNLKEIMQSILVDLNHYHEQEKQRLMIIYVYGNGIGERASFEEAQQKSDGYVKSVSEIESSMRNIADVTKKIENAIENATKQESLIDQYEKEEDKSKSSQPKMLEDQLKSQLETAQEIYDNVKSLNSNCQPNEINRLCEFLGSTNREVKDFDMPTNDEICDALKILPQLQVEKKVVLTNPALLFRYFLLALGFAIPLIVNEVITKKTTHIYLNFDNYSPGGGFYGYNDQNYACDEMNNAGKVCQGYISPERAKEMCSKVCSLLAFVFNTCDAFNVPVDQNYGGAPDAAYLSANLGNRALQITDAIFIVIFSTASTFFITKFIQIFSCNLVPKSLNNVYFVNDSSSTLFEKNALPEFHASDINPVSPKEQGNDESQKPNNNPNPTETTSLLSKG